MENDPNWYFKHYSKGVRDAKIIYKRLENSGWIEKFRNSWNLPPNGCYNITIFQKWYYQFVDEDLKRVVLKKSYRKMQDELRKKKLGWVNGKVLFSEIEKYEFEMSKKIPDFKFNHDIQNIMSELKIPQYYKLFVHDSLVYGQYPINFPLEKDLPKIDFSFDPDTRRKRLFVEVFSDTKAKDFSNPLFQLKLKEYQEKLYDHGTIKQLGAKNIDKNDEIYRMHYIEGKSIKCIQNELGIRNVATILKRHKKNLGLGTRKNKK